MTRGGKRPRMASCELCGSKLRVDSRSSSLQVPRRTNTWESSQSSAMTSRSPGCTADRCSGSNHSVQHVFRHDPDLSIDDWSQYLPDSCAKVTLQGSALQTGDRAAHAGPQLTITKTAILLDTSKQERKGADKECHSFGRTSPKCLGLDNQLRPKLLILRSDNSLGLQKKAHRSSGRLPSCRNNSKGSIYPWSISLLGYKPYELYAHSKCGHD
jgi:hypothetical protein